MLVCTVDSVACDAIDAEDQPALRVSLSHLSPQHDDILLQLLAHPVQRGQFIIFFTRWRQLLLKIILIRYFKIRLLWQPENQMLCFFIFGSA